MATSAFTYHALHTKAKRAYKNTKKNCKSFRQTRQEQCCVGTTAIKPYLSICLVGLVWFARYCGKMYSRHLFPSMRRVYRGYHGLRISFDKHPDKHNYHDSQKLRNPIVAS